MSVTIPIRLVSVANTREHWAKKARRAAAHRGAVRMVLATQGKWCGELPVSVTLTRIAPRPLDGDNNQAAIKSCRDGVADWLGLHDNDPRITWQYAQERGAVKQYAVRIDITEAAS